MSRAKHCEHRQQIHHRVFVGAQGQLAVLQVPQFFDRSMGALTQIQHLLGKIEQHPTRRPSVFRPSTSDQKAVRQVLPPGAGLPGSLPAASGVELWPRAKNSAPLLPLSVLQAG